MTSPVELKKLNDSPFDTYTSLSEITFFDWDVYVVGTCSSKVNEALKENRFKPCYQNPFVDGKLNIDQAIYNIRQSKIFIVCCEPDPSSMFQLGLAYGISELLKINADSSIPMIGYSGEMPDDKGHIVNKTVDVHFPDFESLNDFLARYETILRKSSRAEIIKILSEDFKKPKDDRNRIQVQSMD